MGGGGWRQEPPPPPVSPLEPCGRTNLKISSEITWNSFFFFLSPPPFLRTRPTCQYFFACPKGLFSVYILPPPSTNVPVGAISPARDCSKSYLEEGFDKICIKCLIYPPRFSYPPPHTHTHANAFLGQTPDQINKHTTCNFCVKKKQHT